MFALHQVTVSAGSLFGSKEEKTQSSGLNKQGLFFSHGKKFRGGLLLALLLMPSSTMLFFTQSS